MSDVWLPENVDNTSREREARRFRSLRNRHWSMIRLSAFIVVMAVLLEVRADQRIQFRWGPEWALPESCGSKILFNQECPGCGLTRAFIWLTRGQATIAWQLNRMSLVLAFAVLAQFPYRAWALVDLRDRQARGQKPPSWRWPAWIGWTLAGGLFTSWILKQFGV